MANKIIEKNQFKKKNQGKLDLETIYLYDKSFK